METFEWFFIPTFSALSCNACINFLIFLNFLFTYFIPAARGLRCCMQAFSGCGAGTPLALVPGLLTAAASLVAERGALAHRLSICGAWGLPGPAVKPVPSVQQVDS